MLDQRRVYLNGKFIQWPRARVHLMSHSFARGSAIFEVLSVHDTEIGVCIFRLDRHLERLFSSAALLGMNLPLGIDEFHRACCQTVVRNDIRQGFIKIVCYYPQVAFDIFPPQGPLDVAVLALDPATDLNGNRFDPAADVSAAFSRWHKLDPQTVPVEAKASANYLNGMLARLEARERGYDQVIMLDTQGFVAEGGTESVFMVQNGMLYTPCPGTVLLSISRQSLLEAAPALGIKVFEQRIHPDRFMAAEEIFFSGTPSKVLPVNQIEKRRIDETPGPLTRRLAALMSAITAAKNDQFINWLFPVRASAK